MQRLRVSLFLLAVLTACRATPQQPGAQLVAPQPAPQDPLETIARYEDARTDGDGLLQSLLQKGDPRTRERAAVALGRLDSAEFGAAVTDGLIHALDDESPAVRAAAAFALGLRADPAASGALLSHWRDPDPLVRACIVEAASRIDDPRLRAANLLGFEDKDPRVRSEAVLAPSRYPKLPDAPVTDGALVDFLARNGPDAQTLLDPDVRWRGLFTLSRRKSERARDLFVAGLGSADARARVFAARGLAEVLSDDATVAALVKALADPDWRVGCEAAVALGRQPAASAIPALGQAAQKHASAHVRRAAVAALGAYTASAVKDQTSEVNRHLIAASADTSAEVRGAAVIARAQVFGNVDFVRVQAAQPDPLTRAAAAAAAAKLESTHATTILVALSRDADLRVAGIAIEGLGKQPGPASRARLLELLAAPDNGLRLAAVEALREGKMATEADIEALTKCLETAKGDIAPELAAAVMNAAAEVGGDAALDLLRKGLAHQDAFVRRKSRQLVASKYPAVALPRPYRGEARAAAVIIPDKNGPRGGANPRVEVVTNRGTMVFELFPTETPNHVHNFLALAERHHYDGLTFHRVELDFVIQGGDHRGDGNGGITWRGEPLRAEFTPRKYVRGSLGMPRNEDPDSGGSQFFVTHRETPHLDGRYTVFGEMLSGFDTLDAIEVGDRIETVRVLPAR